LPLWSLAPGSRKLRYAAALQNSYVFILLHNTRPFPHLVNAPHPLGPTGVYNMTDASTVGLGKTLLQSHEIT